MIDGINQHEWTTANITVKQYLRVVKTQTGIICRNLTLDEKLIKLQREKLKELNVKLWDIEEGKRNFEKKKDFGKEFIKLAREVYKFNDERAEVKSEINRILGSNIKEVKSY